MGLATELADYLSGLTVTQGRLTGQPFRCSLGNGVSLVELSQTALETPA